MPRFIRPLAGDPRVASGAWHHSTLQGRDVYIVEDEALIAMLLDDLLQVFGCQVVEIASRVGSECARAP
jgi:hypothetical protein